MRHLFIASFFFASASAFADSASDYAAQCASCHGPAGAGDGTPLPVTPANFQEAAFWSSRTDAQIKGAIKGGGASVGKSPMMPPLGAAWSDAQLDAMVAYLKTFKK